MKKVKISILMLSLMGASAFLQGAAGGKSPESTASIVEKYKTILDNAVVRDLKPLAIGEFNGTYSYYMPWEKRTVTSSYKWHYGRGISMPEQMLALVKENCPVIGDGKLDAGLKQSLLDAIRLDYQDCVEKVPATHLFAYMGGRYYLGTGTKFNPASLTVKFLDKYSTENNEVLETNVSKVFDSIPDTTTKAAIILALKEAHLLNGYWLDRRTLLMNEEFFGFSYTGSPAH